MTLEEVNKELDKLAEEDIDKENRIYKLKNLQVKLIQEKCKKNIGRCFKHSIDDGSIVFVKIISVPPIEYQERKGDEINEYEYPALWIYPNNKIEPFQFNDLFSGAWGKGNWSEGQYLEINKDEFNTVFNQICDGWKTTIINI